jgi:hypothetical protein
MISTGWWFGCRLFSRGRVRNGRVGVVLTSLLPGLRELRAPLSAGTIWLLAGWFAVEPSVPASGEASRSVPG